MPNEQQRATGEIQRPGFMTRLARDSRGNTMAIMGAALIPLAGMVGGGVDIARMYIVKTRLQHACDAGALAGRKAMGGGVWSQTVNGVQNYPNIAAGKFFDANYQSDAYGASGVTKTFTENAGKVSGAASATLPMTLMRIFGQTTQTLSVTCDAEMRLPNTDVMFVLDNTASMGDKAVATDSVTKIQALRTAVKCFYEIVARLDTTETCTGGNPSGGTGDQVQIRFGFMPYATNVNVGKLLPTSYFANSWPYQSREVSSIAYPTNGTATQVDSSTTWNNAGNWVSQGYYKSGSSVNNCKNNVPATTTTGGTTTNTVTSTTAYPGYRTVTYRADTPQTQVEYRYNSYSSSNGGRCYYDTRTTTGNIGTNYTRNDTAQVTWRYAKITQDISGLKDGTNWNSSTRLDIDTNGATKTISWDGCIEERATTRASSYDPIPTAAYDLNIDLVPSQGTPTSLWGPALPGMIYSRDVTSNGYGFYGSLDYNDATTTTNYANYSNYYCPQEARKLQSWTDSTSFESYVDSLTPDGNTYHDIGLLWGARFMSPTGLFASENAYTPQGGEIERHLIFMTDGDTNTSSLDYAAYGVPWWDRRQTATSSAPSNTDLNDQVNARFLALCTAIKNKNITLWVISFGTGSNATTEDRLETCATGGRYFVARDSATLQTTFRSIADQISQLRLTK